MGRRWVELEGYDDFQADMRKLRKLRSLEVDIKEIKDYLLQHACEHNPPQHLRHPGGQGEIWKLRWQNTSKRVGRSGGLRFLYFAPADPDDVLYPFRIYDKTDRPKLSEAEFRKSRDNVMDAVSRLGQT